MNDLDKSLKAIADLCPKNIPEIENLPVVNLQVGDQCLLVWSNDKEFWRIKSFCANDGVDIVCDKFDAHMEVPKSELRLASDLFDARQSEIDQLKAQLIDQGQRFNDQSQKVRDFEFKCEGLEKRIYSALMLIQRNQLYIPALVMEQIGKVLRGGHE